MKLPVVNAAAVTRCNQVLECIGQWVYDTRANISSKLRPWLESLLVRHPRIVSPYYRAQFWTNAPWNEAPQWTLPRISFNWDYKNPFAYREEVSSKKATSIKPVNIKVRLASPPANLDDPREFTKATLKWAMKMEALFMALDNAGMEVTGQISELVLNLRGDEGNLTSILNTNGVAIIEDDSKSLEQSVISEKSIPSVYDFEPSMSEISCFSGDLHSVKSAISAAFPLLHDDEIESFIDLSLAGN